MDEVNTVQMLHINAGIRKVFSVLTAALNF